MKRNLLILIGLGTLGSTLAVWQGSNQQKIAVKQPVTRPALQVITEVKKSNVATVMNPDETLQKRIAAVSLVLSHGKQSEVSDLFVSLQQLAAQSPSEETTALLEALSSPMSSQAMTACANLLANRDRQLPDFELLDPAFMDSLRKGLQAQLMESALAGILSTVWATSPDEVIRQRLESMEIPSLYASLAMTQATSDPEESAIYLTRLETCHHPATAATILAMANSPGASVNEMANILFNWTSEHASTTHINFFEGILSDPAYSPTQQGLAALALAATPDATAKIPAIHKAMTKQQEGWLKARLSQSIEMINHPMQAVADTSMPPEG